ncbi:MULTISPECIES: hypothetical protein [unclassified Pseudomonas]|uniref:hypothetical protein n=1 Tax=unclassified Pseudomonas TaxID=196821 RepID=UPI001FD40B1F|nr:MULTISPECIES: hypothetical protein [unclassified Pseudomonas]
MLLEYGAITVMFPIALVIAGWLWLAGSRAACTVWLLTVLCAYGLVGASKILFKGWGIGLPSLNIAVFSGHAMNACLMVPVLASVLARQVHPYLRWPAALAGIGFGVWFAATLVGNVIHPMAEAIMGALIGGSAAFGFLLVLERWSLQRLGPATLLPGLMLITLAGAAPKFTAEHWLDQVATSLSGATKPFRHADLKRESSTL